MATLHQRNSLNRVSVEFTALEEGALAIPARPIGVVKGSRVSPYDGHVVAVDGAYPGVITECKIYTEKSTRLF